MINLLFHDGQVLSIALVVAVDIVMGLLIAFKAGTIESTKGIDGVLRKCSIILVLVMFFLLNLLIPDIVPSVIVHGVFLAMLGFELVSISENLSSLGINIPGLDKYFKYVNNKEDGSDETVVSKHEKDVDKGDKD